MHGIGLIQCAFNSMSRTKSDNCSLRRKTMFGRTMAIATIATAMMGSPLLAQEAPVTPGNLSESAEEGNLPRTDPGSTGAIARDDFASEDERMFYTQSGPLLGGFFTDPTMAELRPEAQVRETFAAMGAEDQDEVRAACDRVDEKRGSYGSVTVTLCSQIGVL
jgi:hypothetical protein